MKLSKKSWHYRLVKKLKGESYFGWPSFDPVKDKWIYDAKRINLCPYTRTVVKCVVSYPFIIGWRRLPQRIQDHPTLTKLCATVASLDLASYYLDPRAPWVIGSALLAVAAIFGTICLGLFIAEKIKDWRKTKYTPVTHSPKMKEPNIFVESIKASHNKICPAIEFTEES